MRWVILAENKARRVLLEALPLCFDLAVQALARIGSAGLEALARQEFDEEGFEEAARPIAGLGASVRPMLLGVLLRRPRCGLVRYAFQQLHDA